MTTTISASSTGLNYTSDASGALAFLTGANTATLTLNANQTASFSGQISAPQMYATNGIIVTTATINTNYTIATGSNAMSVGPVTISSGTTVTIGAGQRWVVL